MRTVLSLSLSLPRVARLGKLGLVLVLLQLLAACASGPQTARGPVNPLDVKVSGSVNRDFTAAVEYLQGERYPEAIALLQTVVEREQRLSAPYVNLGIAYYRTGDEKHAEESFLEALRAAPLDPVASNELGVLYRRQGRFEEARATYSKSLQLHPDNLPLIKNLGILCDLYLQEPNCALAQFERYLQYQPDDAKVAIWVTDLKRRVN
ncbi:tetratricopeptide repeat protein [Microbulbifer agarilyticus]|uniref:tetratricopeptide repeat protein n=1 Tax=Microbulbifer agarilyticus TaxID=260552 RepID=UPI001C963E06|nr:tetratricopeptide repeat protein [Microbulbifer agarilyticus]MBY6190444.1 tetratricopeptide repeat protein [Microbulbifer agarilyticus]